MRCLAPIYPLRTRFSISKRLRDLLPSSSKITLRLDNIGWHFDGHKATGTSRPHHELPPPLGYGMYGVPRRPRSPARPARVAPSALAILATQFLSVHHALRGIIANRQIPTTYQIISGSPHAPRSIHQHMMALWTEFGYVQCSLVLVLCGLFRLRPMSYEISLAPQRPIRTSTECHVLPRQCTCTDAA